MTSYQRVAVASTFSPTFAAVLAEAARFAAQQGAVLEVIHAASYDAEKERRFIEALGTEVVIRWVEGETPAHAIIAAAEEFAYDLLIAGALQREDGEKPFTSGVARDLLRRSPCDLLLLPGPTEDHRSFDHVVFVFDPGENRSSFVLEAVASLSAQRVTIAAPKTPFAAALAALRGEEPCDAGAWGDALAEDIRQKGVEVETWIVDSNTGYSLCDAVQGTQADLLVVKTVARPNGNPLPVHLDWLFQIIPMRLLVVRENPEAPGPE